MILEPLPDFSFRHSAHDRLSEHRNDETFLAEAWNNPDTRVLVMRGWKLATEDRPEALHFVSPREAPPGERMLLGRADGVVHFMVLTPAEGDAPGYTGLRHLATGLSRVQASLAVHAVSLAGWHLRHPKCSVCGSETAVALAGESRRCRQCSAQHFPRTDPAVIMLAVDADDRCLLGHNAARPQNWYSTLAGFVEPGESSEQAVVREVREETGVDVSDVTYAGSQPWPFPASLMLGFFARATITDIRVDGDEITEARWFSRADLKREVEAGELGLPTTISIAGALLTHWYGGELPTNRLHT